MHHSRSLLPNVEVLLGVMVKTSTCSNKLLFVILNFYSRLFSWFWSNFRISKFLAKFHNFLFSIAQCVLCKVRCHFIFSGPGIRYSDIFGVPGIREGLNGKKRFLSGIARIRGGRGVYPCPNFLAPYFTK